MAETGELEEVEPEWKPVVCWAHCGGKCGLKAYVKDGTVLRLKTDDTHDDSFNHPQHRACLRGRSRKFDVFSKDRVRFPMKRKHWQPGAAITSTVTYVALTSGSASRGTKLSIWWQTK